MPAFPTVTALVTCLALSAACCVAAPPKKAVRPKPPSKATAKPSPAALQAQDELQALYAQQDGAFAQKNLDGMFAAYAPDFVVVDVDGETETAAEQRKMFSTILPGLKSAAAADIIQSVTMDGDNAIATVSEHIDMIVTRRADGAVGDIVDDNVSRDYWVKTPGGWQLKRSRYLSEKETLNGKPMPKH